MLSLRVCLLESSLGKEIGRGGNAIAYEIEGRGDVIAKRMPARKIKWERPIADALESVPGDVNVARVLGIERSGDDIIVIQARAPGRPLHDRAAGYDVWKEEIRRLASVPQGHYDKLVSDNVTLIKHGLMCDPSKPDNFFYDPSKGFTFIDMNLGDQLQSLLAPVVHTGSLYNRFKRRLVEDDMRDVSAIISKLGAAGDSCHGAREIFGLFENIRKSNR